MKRSVRWMITASGIFLLSFGLACLNLRRRALERHREFARRHDLRQPGNSIMWGGAAGDSVRRLWDTPWLPNAEKLRPCNGCTV